MIILDTNVTSELMRAAPSPEVAAWVQSQNADELYTTSITVAEIEYRIAHLPNGARRKRLGGAAGEVFSAFADHVLAFDLGAAGEYAELVAERERSGRPINGFDAQIAAICRIHNAVLATRNVKEFQESGVRLTNPWMGGSRRQLGPPPSAP